MMFTVRIYTERGGFLSNGVTYASQEEAEEIARARLQHSSHLGAEIRSGKTVVAKILR